MQGECQGGGLTTQPPNYPTTCLQCRANVKVAVKDVVKARSAYGPYVTPISLDISNPAELKKALKGVNAIVVVGKLGAIPKVRNRGSSQQSINQSIKCMESI